MPKGQKTFSLPSGLVERVHKDYEASKEWLPLIGINNESQYVALLVTNGLEAALDLIHYVKEREHKRKSLAGNQSEG